MRLKPILAGVALGCLVFAAGAVQAEPVKLRVGWVVAPADSPLALFGKTGVTKHEGVSYTLDAIHFNGTPPMITALSTGEIDLVPFAYSTFALAVQNANMSDLRIIGDVFQDGVEGYKTNNDWVLKDGPIKTVKDLKGKVLASNASGSAVDMAMRAMLRKNGLDDRKDVTTIEVGFPNMKAVLADHKADLITGVLPFDTDPELQKIGRVLFTQKQAIGRSQMIILTARTAFLQKNRAAVIDYLEDSLRLQRWYSNPANHEEAVKLVADYTKRPAQIYASWLFTKADYYRDPNGKPDLGALQANINTQQQLGFLKAKLDVKKYADLSFVEEAAKRIK